PSRTTVKEPARASPVPASFAVMAARGGRVPAGDAGAVGEARRQGRERLLMSLVRPALRGPEVVQLVGVRGEVVVLDLARPATARAARGHGLVLEVDLAVGDANAVRLARGAARR